MISQNGWYDSLITPRSKVVNSPITNSKWYIKIILKAKFVQNFIIYSYYYLAFLQNEKNSSAISIVDNSNLPYWFASLLFVTEVIVNYKTLTLSLLQCCVYASNWKRNISSNQLKSKDKRLNKLCDNFYSKLLFEGRSLIPLWWHLSNDPNNINLQCQVSTHAHLLSTQHIYI